MGIYTETFNRISSGYELYNANVESFFVENSVYSAQFAAGDDFSNTLLCGPRSLVYVHEGDFKLYVTSIEGKRSFIGYMPRYSTYFPTAQNGDFGKYMQAVDSAEVLVATTDDYVDFISSSKDLMLHQFREAYHRRNLNDFPRYQTLGLTAREKTWFYVLYLGMRFGEPLEGDVNRLVVRNPPMLKDIADFNGTHPNNVSKYVGELGRMGLARFSARELFISDFVALEEAFDELEASDGR